MVEKHNPMADYLKEDIKLKLSLFTSEKHPKSICIVNYKGGVGKTTISCLLGYYISQMHETVKRGKESLRKKKKVLLLDIDPQCSLSLAVGFDPEDVNKTELTMYNLVKPTKWAKISKTKFSSYIQKVPDTLAPSGLYIIPGSFDIDDLDMEIGEHPIKKFGSQGQQKSFLIALKFAQFQFMKSQQTGTPILLLDDIFDKLDENRVAHIISLVNQDLFGQIFISDTHAKRTENIVREIHQTYAFINL